MLLRIYRHLPKLGRRWAVRIIAPSFTVGAMCIIERPDGAVLLVRHLYRRKWGIPGGLLARRESPEDAARREVWEEVRLRVELQGEPAIVVDPEPQRVDIIFRARPAADADVDNVGPGSVEIVQARWFPLGELPELQHEAAGALVAAARAARGQQERFSGAPFTLAEHRRDDREDDDKA